MALTLNWTIPQPVLDMVFTPLFANELSESKTARDEIGFAKTILQKAPHHLGVNLQSCPSSMAEFLSSLKPILSQRSLSQIADNARFFGLLCGGKIADNLIANIPFAGWLIQLAETVAARYEDTASASTTPESSRAQSVSLSQILGTVSSHTSRSHTYRSFGLGFDGTGDEPDEKIVQVELTGPNITTAWKNNSTVVNRQYNTNYTLLKLETTYALPRDKTPADAGSYDVFHGTNRHLTGLPDWPDKWHSRALNLRGADQACQMNPMGVRVVYTSFSPLRAFLWAAFKDHIYRNVPGTIDREFMSSTWTTQGRTYRGVAVFAFSTATPTPSRRLSHVTLPKDKSAPRTWPCCSCCPWESGTWVRAYRYDRDSVPFCSVDCLRAQYPSSFWCSISQSTENGKTASRVTGTLPRTRALGT